MIVYQGVITLIFQTVISNLWSSHTHLNTKSFPVQTGHFRWITYNSLDSNIVDISGALFILRILFEYTQTRCGQGARHNSNIWVPVVTNRITLYAWFSCHLFDSLPECNNVICFDTRQCCTIEFLKFDNNLVWDILCKITSGQPPTASHSKRACPVIITFRGCALSGTGLVNSRILAGFHSIFEYWPSTSLAATIKNEDIFIHYWTMRISKND